MKFGVRHLQLECLRQFYIFVDSRNKNKDTNYCVLITVVRRVFCMLCTFVFWYLPSYC
jgi:hypothetical protein